MEDKGSSEKLGSLSKESAVRLQSLLIDDWIKYAYDQIHWMYDERKIPLMVDAVNQFIVLQNIITKDIPFLSLQKIEGQTNVDILTHLASAIRLETTMIADNVNKVMDMTGKILESDSLDEEGGESGGVPMYEIAWIMEAFDIIQKDKRLINITEEEAEKINDMAINTAEYYHKKVYEVTKKNNHLETEAKGLREENSVLRTENLMKTPEPPPSTPESEIKLRERIAQLEKEKIEQEKKMAEQERKMFEELKVKEEQLKQMKQLMYDKDKRHLLEVNTLKNGKESETKAILEASEKEKQTEFSKFEKEINELKSRLTSIEEENEEMREKISELERENRELQERAKEIQEEFDEFKDSDVVLTNEKTRLLSSFFKSLLLGMYTVMFEAFVGKDFHVSIPSLPKEEGEESSEEEISIGKKEEKEWKEPGYYMAQLEGKLPTNIMRSMKQANLLLKTSKEKLVEFKATLRLSSRLLLYRILRALDKKNLSTLKDKFKNPDIPEGLFDLMDFINTTLDGSSISKNLTLSKADFPILKQLEKKL
jgi:hypothetical protein